MKNRNTLITLTGPSGFNKSALIKTLLDINEDFIKVISHTDRPKRENEVDGVDFHFVTEKEFNDMVQSEKFLEWQRVPSNNFRYGKTKRDITEALTENNGKVVFTRVNIINLPVFKRHYPESVSIFIDLKDSVALVEYLKSKAQINDDEEFDRRQKFATEERRRRHLADFIVSMKDTEEETVQEILKIVEQIRK
jgi:guanylate kinase